MSQFSLFKMKIENEMKLTLGDRVREVPVETWLKFYEKKI